jgi:hypothetical protein
MIYSFDLDSRFLDRLDALPSDETLLLYASVLAKPRRDQVNGSYQTNAIGISASKCIAAIVDLRRAVEQKEERDREIRGDAPPLPSRDATPSEVKAAMGRIGTILKNRLGE